MITRLHLKARIMQLKKEDSVYFSLERSDITKKYYLRKLSYPDCKLLWTSLDMTAKEMDCFIMGLKYGNHFGAVY